MHDEHDPQLTKKSEGYSLDTMPMGEGPSPIIQSIGFKEFCAGVILMNHGCFSTGLLPCLSDPQRSAVYCTNCQHCN